MSRWWRRILGAMGGIALIGALLAALISDWICGTLLFGHWSPLHLAGIGLFALLGAVLVILAWLATEDQAKAISTRLLVAAGSLGFTLLALDIGMRLTDPPPVYSTPFYENHEVLGHFTAPNSRHRFLTPDLRYTTFRTDENGLIIRGKPNDPEPVATRVLFLGDSFVEGVQVPATSNLSVITENLLNATDNGSYQSINLGVSAYSPVHYYLAYKMFAETFDPAIVVVGIFVGNDFKDSAELHEDGWLTTDEQGYPLAVHPRMEDGMVMVHPASEPVPATTLKATIVSPGLWHRGILATGFYAGYRPYCGDRQREVQRAALEAAYAERLAKLGDDTSILTVYLPGQDETEDWAYMTADLDLLAMQLQEDERQLIIAIFPDSRQIPGQGMWLRDETGLPNQMAIWSDLPQDYMNDFCRSRGLTCIDLLPLFKARSDVNEMVYWSNDMHLTARGHELAAEAIVEAILNQQ